MTIHPDPAGRALLESLDVVDLAACVDFGEGRGEPTEGRQAILCTSVNRARALLAAKRAATHREALRLALLRRWAYSALEPHGGPDDPTDADDLSENYETVLDAARALQKIRATARGEPVVGAVPTVGPILRDCLRLAQLAADDRLKDVTEGSTHYLTADLFRTNPPSWARGRTPTCRINNHLFFVGVA